MIYYISGLGADERVFKYLNIGNLEYKYIKWETPLNHEKLEDYFPVTHIKNYVKIAGGGHFMIVNKAKEISEIIRNEMTVVPSQNDPNVNMP